MVDGPLITRIGVASDFFDKQIDGLPGDGDGLSSQTPTPIGLFQKVIGVGWGGGFVVYAATSTPSDSNTTRATMASSKDGITWEDAGHFSSAGALCGISGKTDNGVVLLVGGYYQQTFPDGPGTATLMFPQFYVSTDQGKSWSPNRLSWNTSATFDPETGATFTAGCVSGVGFDPSTKKFYAVIQKHESTAGVGLKATQLFYSGDADGFSQQSSQFLFDTSGSTSFSGPPQAPWPAKAQVNDTPVTLDGTDSDNQFLVYATSPNANTRYASVNVDPQQMSKGGNMVTMESKNQLSSSLASAFAASGTLSKSALVYIDGSGAAIAVPTGTGQGGNMDFDAGFTLDLSTISVCYIIAGGVISSIESGFNEYASVSFSDSSTGSST